MADEKDKEENEESTKDGDKEGEGAEGGAEGEKSGKKKKGGKAKLIIIILAVVIIITIPTVLIFTGVIKIPAHKKSANIEGQEGATGGDAIHEQIVYYDLEEFVVNLNVGSKSPSFLKMTVSLELPGESYIPSIESKLPRIRDSFQIYLRELRREDLQGSSGMFRLREELLLRVNKIVYPSRVNDILFKEILVQ